MTIPPSSSKVGISRSVVITGFVALSLAVYAWAQNFFPERSQYNFIFPPFRAGRHVVDHAHLGAEYRNVARALCAGDGFTSPFGIRSGPTAWVAPALAYLQAGIMLLAGGSIPITMHIVAALNATVFTLVAVDVARQIRQRGIVPDLLIAACVGIVLVANFLDNFQRTHDGWYLLGVFHLIVISARHRPREPTPQFSVLWGLLGGIASLSSPAILLAWLVLTACWLSASMRDAFHSSRLQSQVSSDRHVPHSAAGKARITTGPLFRIGATGWALAVLIAFLVHSPWLIRNYVLFHRIVPIKSNGLFELEQSLFRDDDGVVDYGRDVKHPYASRMEARKHAELGEYAYIEQRTSHVRTEFVKHINRYLLQVFNRFCAMTWYQLPQLPLEEDYTWTRITRFLFALPLAAFLPSLWSPHPLSSHQKDTLVLLVSYLLPFLLFSYYSRYMVPTMGIRCLLLLWGIERWIVAVRRHH